MIYDTLLIEHNDYTTLILKLKTEHDPGLSQSSQPHNPPLQDPH